MAAMSNHRYKELVPTAQTPAALINGKMVWESSNILDEIEEAFPEPSLKPTNDQEEELALRVKTLTEDELGVKGTIEASSEEEGELRRLME